jgi:nucleotide-binding universal stress UspA family protein
MQIISKILCPIDFSEPSLKGLKSAVTVALHYDSELVLLHVVSAIPVISALVPTLATPLDVNGYQEQIVKEAKDKLHTLKAEFSINDRVKTLVKVGVAADQIIKAADSEDVELIVIATHGHTGWRRFNLGSVTEKVIRNASCYVLSVPASHE